MGTTIQNLRIAGHDMELQSMVSVFSELNTMSKLRAYYKSNAEFRSLMQETAQIGKRAELTDARLHKFFPWSHREPTDDLPEFRNTTILPLFRIMNKSEPGFTVVGNVVYIQNFGRIHVGELVVTAYERRVNALHIDLGSPVGGCIDACSVGGNGSTNDPPPEGD